MPKSPMDILDERLIEIREKLHANNERKEEISNELHELNLSRIHLEHSKQQYEDAMTVLKRNEVNK